MEGVGNSRGRHALRKASSTAALAVVLSLSLALQATGAAAQATAPGPGRLQFYGLDMTPSPTPRAPTPTPNPASQGQTQSPFTAPAPGTPGGPGSFTGFGSQSCPGVAYDAYLDSCTLWLDAPPYDYVQEATEATATITDGGFTVPASTLNTQNGFIILVPAPKDNVVNVTAKAPGNPCYDRYSLFKRYLPMAAFPPTTCGQIVVDPFTTLLVYGYNTSITATMLKQAFGLDSGVVIGGFDSYNAFLLNPTDTTSANVGRSVYLAELMVNNFVQIVTTALTAKPRLFANVAQLVNNQLARQVVTATASKGRHRLLLQSTALLDLTDPATLAIILTNAQVTVVSGLGSSVTNTLPANVLDAIVNAVANMNTVTKNAASPTAATSATMLAADGLSARIAALAADPTNPALLADLQSYSSLSSLTSIAASIKPPGQLTQSITPSSAPTSAKSKLSGGAIAGIVIGCVAGVAIIAGGAFMVVRRRQRFQAGAGATTSYAPTSTDATR